MIVVGHHIIGKEKYRTPSVGRSIDVDGNDIEKISLYLEPKSRKVVEEREAGRYKGEKEGNIVWHRAFGVFAKV